MRAPSVGGGRSIDPCALVGAGELAQELEPVLELERGRIAVRGLVTSHGPVPHALALCAIARGERPRAAQLLTEARAQAERAAAVGWLWEIEASERRYAAS